jgi:hypothetical protein
MTSVVTLEVSPVSLDFDWSATTKVEVRKCGGVYAAYVLNYHFVVNLRIHVIWIASLLSAPHHLRQYPSGPPQIPDLLGAHQQRAKHLFIRPKRRNILRIPMRVQHLPGQPKRFIHMSSYRPRAGQNDGIVRLDGRWDLVVYRHLRPEVKRLFSLGGEADRDQVGAGANHMCVEDNVGIWMYDVAHM